MAAKLFLACVVLLGLAMAAAAARPATTTDAPGNCDNDLNDLITNCQDYVKFPDNPKIPPSDACCSVVQRVDIPCLCAKVTPTVMTIISMDKVVYVAGYCERPFKPGSKCGSYTVPGPLA